MDIDTSDYFPHEEAFCPHCHKKVAAGSYDHTPLMMREFSKLVTIVGTYSTDALDATYVERQSPSASKAQKYI